VFGFPPEHCFGKAILAPVAPALGLAFRLCIRRISGDAGPRAACGADWRLAVSRFWREADPLTIAAQLSTFTDAQAVLAGNGASHQSTFPLKTALISD
jgi:hypothetical protein